jgi:hypothetical protein
MGDDASMSSADGRRELSLSPPSFSGVHHRSSNASPPNDRAQPRPSTLARALGCDEHGSIKALGSLLALSMAFLLAACGQQAGTPGSSSPTPSATTSVSPTPTPTPTPEPSLTPSPSSSPTAAATPVWPPAGFTTGAVSGGSSARVVNVTAVRVGGHPGYDRFVIEFSGAVPSYTVTLQSNSRFTLDPKGGTVTLEGTNGVLITVQHINWTAYAGPTSLRPEFTYLREARLIQNFEGVQQWGLGIAGTAAVRVFTLTSPARLVVDITTQ